MKLFVKKGILFILIIVILNTVFYIITYHNYYKIYTPVINNQKYHSFLFADSHGLPLKNYLGTSGIFNFSVGSDSYVDIYRKISFLIENGFAIKTVFLSADGAFLSHYKEDYNNSSRSIYYTNYQSYKITSTKPDYLSFIMDKYLKYYFVFLNSEAKEIIKIFIKKTTCPIFFVKKTEKNIKWVQVINKEEISKKRYRILFPDSVKSLLMENCLKEIFILCKRKNIKVIGIKYPFTRSLIKVMGSSWFNAENIFSQYKINILDFRSTFEGKDELFLNPDHLNDKGGKVFSEQLLLKL